MPTTKSGEKISWKEWMKRWKQGIEGITPIQRLKNELISSYIGFVGNLICIACLIIFRDKLLVQWFSYGLILIFIGTTWSTGIKILTTRQQLKFFKNMDSSSMDINDVFSKLGEEIKEYKGGK